MIGILCDTGNIEGSEYKIKLQCVFFFVVFFKHMQIQRLISAAVMQTDCCERISRPFVGASTLCSCRSRPIVLPLQGGISPPAGRR